MDSQLKTNSIKHLEIILKISERCNINCDYCYVFNKGNSDANDNPARISDNNINHLIGFFQRACLEYDVPEGNDSTRYYRAC
ncbi:galns arylsulfatase regulator (Fe-S oxidoreductase) [Yersinia aldovae]|uniref:Galns arylsulfatase regulator (Fe-S oxidoreductase) n=1 Tax=Yersinia aldovae TaxID=29483 RepID=A0ABM9SX41_YERAL|nr:galns arylsulfatase regulator (Fe-S oxidoreductase) [Yersinia aldovae]